MEPNRVGRILGVGARVAAEKLRERSAQARSAPAPAPPATPAPPAVDGAGPVPAPPPGSTGPGSTGPASTQPANTCPTMSSPPPPARPPTVAFVSSGRPRPAAAVPVQHSRRLARGFGRAGSAFLKPFAHATSILWHQIAGIFFALFALFFLSHAWQVYRAAGAHDRRLDIFAGIGLLFTWFTTTSFWRARKKQQQQ